MEAEAANRHLLIVDRDRLLLYELFAAAVEHITCEMGSRLGRRIRLVIKHARPEG